jgi:hypothetical protein
MGYPVPLPATTAPAPLPHSSMGRCHPVPPTTRCKSSPNYPHRLRPARPPHSRVEPYGHQPPAPSPTAGGGFGVSDIPPVACAAAFLSSATRAASTLSAAATHPHPFSAPASATSACWHFLHTQFPKLCPSPAKGSTATTATQLTQLPTQVCNALTAANRAELTRLWPTDRPRPSSIASPAGPAARGSMRCRTPPLSAWMINQFRTRAASTWECAWAAAASAVSRKATMTRRPKSCANSWAVWAFPL